MSGASHRISTSAQALERFYGRRSGKTLRPHRAQLMKTLLPKVMLQLPLTDTSNWDDLWLEIGFGAGEHLAWQAKAHPRTLLIGCEPYQNGVARLVDQINDDKITNILIHPDDARPVLDQLPEQCLGRVFILFNDPWPKKRHWDRRFISNHNLDRLARIMKKGAELRIATDHPGLRYWILKHTRAHKDFEWKLEYCHQWLARPEDWPATRYEEKALHGRPHFFTFIRR